MAAARLRVDELMQHRLRAALERLWKSLFGARGSSEGKADNSVSAAQLKARHRFWAELREGQREAEVQSRPR